MEDLLGKILGYILFVLLIASAICLIITKYYDLKLKKVVQKHDPDLADIAYGFNFRAFNWKNWGKLKKLIDGEHPEFAVQRKKVNLFIWIAVWCGVAIFVVLVATFIILGKF